MQSAHYCNRKPATILFSLDKYILLDYFITEKLTLSSSSPLVPREENLTVLLSSALHSLLGMYEKHRLCFRAIEG